MRERRSQPLSCSTQRCATPSKSQPPWAASSPEIVGVVAVAPSAYVWAGLGRKPTLLGRPPWTYHGEPLPYLGGEMRAALWHVRTGVTAAMTKKPIELAPYFAAMARDRR